MSRRRFAVAYAGGLLALGGLAALVGDALGWSEAVSITVAVVLAWLSLIPAMRWWQRPQTPAEWREWQAKR